MVSVLGGDLCTEERRQEGRWERPSLPGRVLSQGGHEKKRQKAPSSNGNLEFLEDRGARFDVPQFGVGQMGVTKGDKELPAGGKKWSSRILPIVPGGNVQLVIRGHKNIASFSARAFHTGSTTVGVKGGLKYYDNGVSQEGKKKKGKISIFRTNFAIRARDRWIPATKIDHERLVGIGQFSDSEYLQNTRKN